MVADDHDYMRTIMVEVLRGAGVREIVGVSSAYEALELLPRAQPKMLITDWDMDGMERRRIGARHQRRRKNTPRHSDHHDVRRVAA